MQRRAERPEAPSRERAQAGASCLSWSLWGQEADQIPGRPLASARDAEERRAGEGEREMSGGCRPCRSEPNHGSQRISDRSSRPKETVSMLLASDARAP